jgi:two-component system chemotaxis response regulator CheB
MTDRNIRVLVVDDSAFARKVLREVISAHARMEVVGVARDGKDALEQIEALHPDVVTLDLVMPELDGVGVLQALRSRSNPPAVVVVSMADNDSELGVAALGAGAFDVVHKPTALALDRLYELSGELTAKIVEAALARGGAPRKTAQARAHGVLALPSPTRTSVVVVGASTGGPQAVTRLIGALPADFPVPVLVVLHMPAGYTEPFARRLDADSVLDVIEARNDLELRGGQVVIARAGMHLSFRRDGTVWRAKLELEPSQTLHRPAVDVLFQSAAEVAGAGALGVVLTGMGNDGSAGAAAIRAAGGRVLTETESSCVVYGMPRSVVEAGLSDGAAPIGEMAALIAKNL